jgi:hypothetical protein
MPDRDPKNDYLRKAVNRKTATSGVILLIPSCPSPNPIK